MIEVCLSITISTFTFTVFSTPHLPPFFYINKNSPFIRCNSCFCRMLF